MTQLQTLAHKVLGLSIVAAGAFVKPIRKLCHNMTITCVSVRLLSWRWKRLKLWDYLAGQLHPKSEFASW